MIIQGRRYDNAEPVEIEVSEGCIRQVTSLSESPATARWPYLAPGFVDIQMNGYGGQEFSSEKLQTEDVARITQAMDQFGVSSYCPTVTTNGTAALEHAMRTIISACQQDRTIGRRVLGIHLEGPFITPEDGARGAHPLQHCQSPSWELFQQLQAAADGNICLLTLSPEYDNAPEFIAKVVKSGVTVSIGHTSATSDQIRAAADAGASMSTHLGNGAHRTLPRHPNYIWAQLADDRLNAGLICDGHHIPPEVIQTFVRAKTVDRCFLVSDLSGLAGLPPGRYGSELCELEILSDGRLVVAGQTQLLAGASLPIGTGIAQVMDHGQLSLKQAVDLATFNPARAIGKSIHFLETGVAANLTSFKLDQTIPRKTEISITQLWLEGQTIL